MFGKLAQTHLVRKLMASCKIKLLLRNPPSTGQNCTQGIPVGIGMAGWPAIQGDWRGAITGVGGRSGMKPLGAVGVMGGTLH